MNLKNIEYEPLGRVKAFEFNTLFKAIYGVKNPFQMYKLESSICMNKFNREVEKNLTLFDGKPFDPKNEKHIKTLRKKSIQVVDDKTKPEDIDTKCKYKIYKGGGKKYYAVVLFDNNLDEQSVLFDNNVEDVFVEHVVKYHEKNIDKLEKSMKNQKKVEKWVTSFLSKKKKNATLVHAYETELVKTLRNKYTETYGNKHQRKKDLTIFDSNHFKKWYGKNVMKGGAVGEKRKDMSNGTSQTASKTSQTASKTARIEKEEKEEKDMSPSTPSNREVSPKPEEIIKAITELQQAELEREQAERQYLEEYIQNYRDVAEEQLMSYIISTIPDVELPSISKLLDLPSISELLDMPRITEKYSDLINDYKTNLWISTEIVEAIKATEIVEATKATEIVEADHFFLPINYESFFVDLTEADFDDKFPIQNILPDNEDEEEGGATTGGGTTGGGSSLPKIELTNYYSNRDDTVLGRQYNEPSILQSINATIAFCESIHDFASKISKKTIIDHYKENNEFNGILSGIKADDFYMLQQMRYLAISAKDDPFHDKNFTNMNKLLIHNINVKKLSSVWESRFLSNFYYNILSLDDRNNFYKLNVNVNTIEDPFMSIKHAIRFADYLNDHDFNYFFYDTSIANQKTGDGWLGNHYHHRNLIAALNVKGIHERVTIAKWWDPSGGGNQVWNSNDYIEEKSKNGVKIIKNIESALSIEGGKRKTPNDLFNEVLIESVIQPLSGQSKFLKINNSNEISIENNTKSTLKTHLNVKNLRPGFNINRCVYEIRTTKNINDKLLFYDLKRSGDHGQVMYLKKSNTLNRNKKGFLLTGDSMCATKAILEGVPVLFKLYTEVTNLNESKTDIYFYNPNISGTQYSKREILIELNNSYFTDKTKNIIEARKKESDGKKSIIYTFSIIDGKIECIIDDRKGNSDIEMNSLDDRKENSDIEMNSLELSNIIHAYEFFIKGDASNNLIKLLEELVVQQTEAANTEVSQNVKANEIELGKLKEVENIIENLTKLNEDTQEFKELKAKLEQTQFGTFMRRSQLRSLKKKVDGQIENVQGDLSKNTLESKKNMDKKYIIRLDKLNKLRNYLKDILETYDSIPMKLKNEFDLNKLVIEINLRIMKLVPLEEVYYSNPEDYSNPEEILAIDNIFTSWKSISASSYENVALARNKRNLEITNEKKKFKEGLQIELEEKENLITQREKRVKAREEQKRLREEELIAMEEQKMLGLQEGIRKMLEQKGEEEELIAMEEQKMLGLQERIRKMLEQKGEEEEEELIAMEEQKATQERVNARKKQANEEQNNNEITNKNIENIENEVLTDKIDPRVSNLKILANIVRKLFSWGK
jgi:hypothetical protein